MSLIWVIAIASACSLSVGVWVGVTLLRRAIWVSPEPDSCEMEFYEAAKRYGK